MANVAAPAPSYRFVSLPLRSPRPGCRLERRSLQTANCKPALSRPESDERVSYVRDSYVAPDVRQVLAKTREDVFDIHEPARQSPVSKSRPRVRPHGNGMTEPIPALTLAAMKLR